MHKAFNNINLNLRLLHCVGGNHSLKTWVIIFKQSYLQQGFPHTNYLLSLSDWRDQAEEIARVDFFLDQLCNLNRSGDIPAQSHMRLGVFFPKIPESSWTPKC